jgi:hypothetical protein
VRILKAEVEKGFMRTAVDHELADPKTKINLVDRFLQQCIKITSMSKGKKINISLLANGYFCGNASEIKDVSVKSRKSFLFLLTK